MHIWRAPVPGKLEDTRVIIYTSGTTGTPKGVVHTHRSLIISTYGYSIKSGMCYSANDRVLSYLPTAHVFQYMYDELLYSHGASIWFFQGDLHNLFEDCALVRPTVFVGVPRVYNKIRAKILATVASQGAEASAHFETAVRHKLSALKRGIPTTTTTWDRLLKKVRTIIGLQDVRVMITGSAPLDPAVHEFLQVVVAPIVQGYGLSETGAAVSGQVFAPLTTLGDVGELMGCTEIRLVVDSRNGVFGHRQTTPSW